jgi:S1-C subfamily serine protease
MSRKQPSFFVVWKGRRLGPFEKRELQWMVKAGEIGLLAMVESEGGPLTVGDLLKGKTMEGSGPVVHSRPLDVDMDLDMEPDAEQSSAQEAPSADTEKASPPKRSLYRPPRQVSTPATNIPPIILGFGLAALSAFFLPILCALAALGVSAFLASRKAVFPAAAIAAFTLLVLVGTNFAWISDRMGLAGSGRELELTELHAGTKPAVVQVVLLDDSGEQVGVGSGFFIAPDIVVTNFHVIADADNLVFVFDDQTTAGCSEILGLDPERDLAVLRSDTSGRSVLKLEMGTVHEGERVAVIGSPLGLGGTLSEGIVAAVREDDAGVEFVQMSAAISPGSSGSPVVNRFGRVVGVATMFHTGGQSLNFAVSSRELNKILKNSLETNPQTNPQP